MRTRDVPKISTDGYIHRWPYTFITKWEIKNRKRVLVLTVYVTDDSPDENDPELNRVHALPPIRVRQISYPDSETDRRQWAEARINFAGGNRISQRTAGIMSLALSVASDVCRAMNRAIDPDQWPIPAATIMIDAPSGRGVY